MSSRTTGIKKRLRGDCRCREYAGGRAKTHLYGVSGCVNEQRAAAQLAAESDDVPVGYVPWAFAGR
ncbi:hypothetical protein [Amycolatopsis sp. DSM 110486]|uniref:hypothetical protein n=1 Tax=Amycolatopsis sp. DSM 110486 TaxID=2865832 RepID=UPI001C6A7F17|nr:hypothetical protein [Amycolatopsis sp. DSM 110486]QYN17559.1 hypothetical protein K1T34_32760 [Amycolatopsis sp. DSM 110486]